MNIASSCAFACTASAIYNKYRNIKGGLTGLLVATVSTAATMMILNYILTPIYMGMPREAVANLLIPAILPFNIVKCVLNSALVMLIYKPVTNILRRSGLMGKTSAVKLAHSNLTVLITALFLLASCAGALWIING